MRSARSVLAVLAVVAAFQIFSAPCRGDSFNESKPAGTSYVPEVSTVRRHLLSLGLSLYYFDFQERVPIPLRSNEHGFLPGIRATYQTRAQGAAWYVLAI